MNAYRLFVIKIYLQKKKSNSLLQQSQFSSKGKIILIFASS